METSVKRSSTFMFKRGSYRSSMRAPKNLINSNNNTPNRANREINALLLSPQMNSTSNIEKKQLYHAKLFAKLIFQTENIKTIQNLCHWFRFYTTPEKLMSAILELVNEPKNSNNSQNSTLRRTQFSASTNNSGSSTLKRKSRAGFLYGVLRFSSLKIF